MKNRKNILGIDIGSISIAIAQLDINKNIVNTSYAFHEGDIHGTLSKLLAEYDLAEIDSISRTSSSPDILKTAKSYDSRVSFIKSAKLIHDNCHLDSILIVGGEKFGLITFDRNGEYLNYKSNTSCAAGTGSFLDQQAKRLNLNDISEFSKIALKNNREIPQIASRCAVFAKTDLIHAQQEGFTLSEICDGLSYGLSKNICDTLFVEEPRGDNIIFIGGVSKNIAVNKHISKLLNCKLISDKYSSHYGAIGSALLCQEDDEREIYTYNNLNDIIIPLDSNKEYYYDHLNLTLSKYPSFDSISQYQYTSNNFELLTPVEVDIYFDIKPSITYKVYLGIDIGSTSTKAVLLTEDNNVLSGFYTRTSGRPLEAVQLIFECINDICNKNKVNFDLLAVGTTGSGRKFIGEIIGSDLPLDEITAHARAATQLDPEVDTIIEIGGQDAKFTTLKDGMVTFSIMNNVCAAGTGSFIEEQAKKLACPLSEYAARTTDVMSPLSSDRCTVFMERDINYYMSKGYTVNEVLASVLHSVRDNYLSKVAVESNIGNKIFFQGATAKNSALVAAFEQKLQKPIMVSKFCHLTGALGVALTLNDMNIKETKFKGIDIYKEKISINNEVCDLCTNHCKLKIANVNNKLVAFGFLCGRDYNSKQYVKNKIDFDIIKERNKIFSFTKKNNYKHNFKIGIPASLHLLEDLPLWNKFFDILSIETVISKNISESVKSGKKISGAEFCAPISSLHGHVNSLINKCDFIFLPEYLEVKQKNKHLRRHYCYYTQYSQPIISSVEQITRKTKILSPLIKSTQSNFNTKTQLYLMLKKITNNSVSFLQVSNAYEKALKYFSNANSKIKELYNSHRNQNNNLNVVLLGRPYTVLDNSMNNGIIDIFNKNNVNTFFQDMLDYAHKDHQAINQILKAFHWNYGAKILESAEVIAKQPNTYPVLVTSFKCTPDSFVIEYFKDILESYNKPYLILQLDEHDSNVGYETRIEAALRAFRNHANSKEKSKHINLNHNFSKNISSKKSMFEGKTLLLPNWDSINSKLMQAQLISDGIDARLLEETPDSIQRSLQHNNGQCIPLNVVAQNTMDYIEKYHLEPENTVLWMFKSSISCNIRMYPYYIKKILESKGYHNVSVYIGDITFVDMSYSTAINIYFVHMFGGLIRKIGCKLRPHEIIKGSIDAAIKKSTEILYTTFLTCTSKEDALEKIVKLFNSVKVEHTNKPKIAIFGDLYVRDNDIMNQNLIKTIEDNGGEVVTTPYNEYLKIIAEPYIKKWLNEGLYADAAQAKILQKAIQLMEKKYYKYFNSILNESVYEIKELPQEILSKLSIKLEHTGESMDNILKINALTKHYPDISLFVQTNPAFCCPSIVTEAMAKKIEQITGIPIVTIEYDGTGGNKNEDIIPYIKLPRNNSIQEYKGARG